MRLPKTKEIIPPEKGWKPSTYYVLEVSYNKNNPIHTKIFYSGFLDNDGNPAGYSQFFEGNDNRAVFNSNLSDMYYAKALHEIPWKIDNP